MALLTLLDGIAGLFVVVSMSYLMVFAAVVDNSASLTEREAGVNTADFAV